MSKELQERLYKLGITNKGYLKYVENVEEAYNYFPYNSFLEEIDIKTDSYLYDDFTEREKFLIGVELINSNFPNFSDES